MKPNTVFLLELNPTRSNPSKLGANLWVAKETNKSAGYHNGVRTVSNEFNKNPRIAYYQPDGDLDHHQVVQVYIWLIIGEKGLCIEFIGNGSHSGVVTGRFICCLGDP